MKELIEKLKEIKGVSFVSVTYTNKQNEKHQTLFNVGVSYQKAKQKDIEYLKDLDVSTLETNSSLELLEEARIALLKSAIKPNKNISSGIQDAFEYLGNGIKMHKQTKVLYIYGMQVRKTVIEKGERSEKKSKPLTIAKDEIRRTLKATKYRQFEIPSSEEFSLMGDTLKIGE